MANHCDIGARPSIATGNNAEDEEDPLLPEAADSQAQTL